MRFDWQEAITLKSTPKKKKKTINNHKSSSIETKFNMCIKNIKKIQFNNYIFTICRNFLFY